MPISPVADTIIIGRWAVVSAVQSRRICTFCLSQLRRNHEFTAGRTGPVPAQNRENVTFASGYLVLTASAYSTCFCIVPGHTLHRGCAPLSTGTFYSRDTAPPSALLPIGKSHHLFSAKAYQRSDRTPANQKKPCQMTGLYQATVELFSL